MKGRLSVVLISVALTVAGCSHANRPVPLKGQEDQVMNQLWGCPYGLERFLPGDYYFCEAGSNYWAGRFGMARDNLESAAHWASKPAQHMLGLMYFNGDRAPKNRPLGVAWLALAAERHRPEYEAVFVSAYQQLTPEEHAQADVYWNDMKGTYGDAVAAKRADSRFNREIWKLDAALQFGGTLYINGLGPAPEAGFSLGKRLRNERDTFFAGYDSQVWVGDMQLVPLGQLAAPKKEEKPAASTPPSSN